MSFLDPYKWLISLALVALLAAGGWFAWWHHGHVRFEAGIAAQQAAEAKSLAIYTKARDAQLATAERSYHAEIDSLQLHPIQLGALRLCIQMPDSAPGKQPSSRTVATATGSGNVQPLPSGGGQVRAVMGPDFSSLQSALSMGADRVLAIARLGEKVAK